MDNPKVNQTIDLDCVNQTIDCQIWLNVSGFQSLISFDEKLEDLETASWWRRNALLQI
jgi:hypothetical protein